MAPKIELREIPTSDFASFGLFDGTELVGFIDLVLADDDVICVSRVEVGDRGGEFGFLRLIKMAIRLVRNYKRSKLRCYVNSDDQRLIDLYKRFGGKVVQTIAVIEADVNRNGSNLSRSDSLNANKREG